MKPALWFSVTGDRVTCLLCPHKCTLSDGQRGICRVRVAHDGALHTLVYGNPCSLNIDPIEKKPLFHYLPGKPILSIATAGCNLRCLNCQNWEISQSRPEDLRNMDMQPDDVVSLTASRGVPAIAYTYTEPIVFYEFTRDTAQAARASGIKNVLVTAGYIEEEPLRQLCRVTDAANVDIKSFCDDTYKKLCSVSLRPVLRALEIFREEGVWIELTRLIVPGHSDDMDDIRQMCDWIARTLGPETPIHFSRFHGAYKLANLPPTPPEILLLAKETATAAGLKFVYVGNVPRLSDQNTACPSCGRVLVERAGYSILKNELLAENSCVCGQIIPGVWI